MKWEWRAFMPIYLDGLMKSEDYESTKDVEERTDIYYFTGDAYGVKQRDENEDFEVKVLTERKKRGAEKYKKFITSRDKVHDIVPTFDPTSTNSLPVHKRRKVTKIGKLKHEICYLTVDNKRWKSLSWEGKEAHEVYDAIQVHFNLTDDWTVESLRHAFPSGNHIGGYPSWVMTLAS